MELFLTLMSNIGFVGVMWVLYYCLPDLGEE